MGMPSAFPASIPSVRSGGRRRLLLLPLLAAVLILGGCASGGDGPALPQPITVPLQLQADDSLNAGSDGRGLATVVRIYHLRGMQRFEQAPFDVLMDATREQAALGSDLVQVREVVLTPGMQRAFQEQLSADSTHIGIAALFQEPASGRWRYAFDARADGVAEQGIRLGLHRCAMTTASPALVSAVPGDASTLDPVPCGR